MRSCFLNLCLQISPFVFVLLFSLYESTLFHIVWFPTLCLIQLRAVETLGRPRKNLVKWHIYPRLTSNLSPFTPVGNFSSTPGSIEHIIYGQWEENVVFSLKNMIHNWFTHRLILRWGLYRWAHYSIIHKIHISNKSGLSDGCWDYKTVSSKCQPYCLINLRLNFVIPFGMLMEATGPELQAEASALIKQKHQRRKRSICWVTHSIMIQLLYL